MGVDQPRLNGEAAEHSEASKHGPAGVRSFYLAGLLAKRGHRHRISAIAILLDIAAIMTAYVVVSLAYLSQIDIELISRTLASIVPVYFLFGLAVQSYPANILADGFRSAWRAGAALAWASLLMFLIFFFLKISEEFSRAVLGLGTVLAVVLVGSARLAIAEMTHWALGSDPYANLHLYDEIPKPAPSAPGVLSVEEIGLKPIPDDPAMLDLLGGLVLGLDGVVVHCLPEKRGQWAFMLKSLDVRTEIVMPELSALRPLAIRERTGETSLVLGSGQLAWSQRALKRGFDVLVALAALASLAPLMVLIAIAIKCESKGPALFRQDRIGLGNRKFKILKFRTMRAEMQDEAGEVLTQRADARVTRLGSILRRTSLDELPQFINVLLGEMSIVGPRPHTESAKAGGSLYWQIDRAYWHRHVVKPGITGLAQVRGYRGNTFEERQLQNRLNADLEYVATWSLPSDFMIILRTLGVLVHRNAF